VETSQGQQWCGGNSNDARVTRWQTLTVVVVVANFVTAKRWQQQRCNGSGSGAMAVEPKQQRHFFWTTNDDFVGEATSFDGGGHDGWRLERKIEKWVRRLTKAMAASMVLDGGVCRWRKRKREKWVRRGRVKRLFFFNPRQANPRRLWKSSS